jgi:hypothetical protein
LPADPAPTDPPRASPHEDDGEPMEERRGALGRVIAFLRGALR